MAEQAKKAPPDQKGKPKHRSPNYPVIPLRKAIERIEALYVQYKRHLVPIGVAHEKWGYKAHSGAGNQAVAALRSYGLIDVSGDGESRQIKLSERGYHIVENHRERPALLKAAALGPSIHSELWKKYGDQGLPPDDVLRHHLKFDRNFNPESVDGFIARLRDTITFAGLDSSDKISDTPAADDGTLDDSGGGEGNDGARMNPPVVTNPPKEPPPPVGTMQDTYTAKAGLVVVRWPTSLTAEEWDDLDGWMDMMKRKVKRAVQDFDDTTAN